MNLNAYLFFDGTCEAAFTFYAQCLGGEVQALLRYADSPEGPPPAEMDRDRIMHGCIRIGEQVLMGTDCSNGEPYAGIRGCSLTLTVDSVEQAERLFTALGEGGQVQKPLAQTFWAERFGVVVDRFGVSWMINYAPMG